MVVEHGGALIDTDHNATRNRASSLGLSLDVVAGGSHRGRADKYWIDVADEKYAVRGGNDLLVSRMLEELPANTVRSRPRVVA